MIAIIPAIDIIDGKCVRLTEGDYGRKTVYSEDPVEAAIKFEAAGIERLHLVDLDGAKIGNICNLKILEKVATATKLRIDFGGGIQTEDSLKSVIGAGAALVTLGSVVVKQPKLFDEWVSKFGPETFFIGADVRKGKIAVSVWQ